MPPIIDFVADYWHLLVGIGGLIAWLARLEFRSVSSIERIEHLESHANDVDKRLEKEFLDIKLALTRIETQLMALMKDSK